MKNASPVRFDLGRLTVGGISPSRVSVAQAAQLMGVSHWTVRRWIAHGDLRARRMPGGSLRIAVTDLAEVGGRCADQ